MNLIASLMGSETYDKQLATIEVESDTAAQFYEIVRRRVEGRLTSKGPIWNEYIRFWRDRIAANFEMDGKQFFRVNGLQVDHDFYGNCL